MNKFKRTIGTTRRERLQAERESLEQARDKAIEAAAKCRLVAETALIAMLPRLDVSHCDAEDLAAIQDFLMATDHLKEMADSDPLTLIRSLLESMDSPELHYIRAAHQWNDFVSRVVEEKTRLLAISRLSDLNVFDMGAADGAIDLANCILFGVWDESPSQRMASDKGLTDGKIKSEIEAIYREESSVNDAQNQTAEMSGVQGSREGRRDVSVDVPLPEMSREL